MTLYKVQLASIETECDQPSADTGGIRAAGFARSPTAGGTGLTGSALRFHMASKAVLLEVLDGRRTWKYEC